MMEPVKGALVAAFLSPCLPVAAAALPDCEDRGAILGRPTPKPGRRLPLAAAALGPPPGALLGICPCTWMAIV